jgi:tetratricopeptide (TPR) repeat protein
MTNRGNLMAENPMSAQAQQLVHAAQLHQRGDLAGAEPLYRQLLQKNHDVATTANVLAILLIQTNRHAEAAEQFERAVAAGNTQIDTLYNFGICLVETGKFQRAVEIYLRCVENKPDHSAAWFNLGIAYEKLEQFDDAIKAMLKDYAINDRIEALVELSTIYLRKFDWDNTQKYAIAALEKDPRNETAMHNLSNSRMGRLVGMEVPDLSIVEQSLRLGKSMIAANPRSAKGYQTCGDALQAIGEIDLALDHYEKCLEMDPDNAHVHANVGVIKLMKGELERGWQEVTWREKYGTALYGMDVGSYARCLAPEWDGSVAAGKHLLVASEQGIGDQILQAQLICELIEAGMQVTMTCNDKLASLLQRSLPGATILGSSLPLPDDLNNRIDHKIKQLEMCRLMRPTMESFQRRHTYLQPDPELVADFREKYSSTASAGRNLKVGISWKSASISAGKQKSINLNQWAPILKVPGVDFYCIQYGDYEKDIAAAQQLTGVPIYVDQDFNPLHDIERAAAQIAAMDLIISVSNASVHIAGAMGKPTWVILHYMPLWHWFNTGKTSVWYDSVSLYRQKQLEGWTAILETIASDLVTLQRSQHERQTHLNTNQD